MLCAMPAQAGVNVEAKLDSIQILIGQQAHLKVNVTAPRNARVVWPNYRRAQQIVPGVEVLGATPADTTGQQDGQMTVSRTFTLTSFDEHVYALNFKVKVDGKPYQSADMALKVLTVDVDTLHPNKFFPPKDVQDNPFSWAEWAPVFWLSMLLLLLLGALAWLFIRLKQNKPVIVRMKKIKHIPPQQKAMQRISKIKEEHMDTSENQKQYYTELTDALREYINERFGFNAMKMTSEEIISQLNATGNQAMMNELKTLFTTADLVKFAKYSTLINENDLNLVNAINFINQTKVESKPVEEKVVPVLSEQQQKTRRHRVTIKLVLWVLGLLAAALLAYIVWNICMLES